MLFPQLGSWVSGYESETVEIKINDGTYLPRFGNTDLSGVWAFEIYAVDWLLSLLYAVGST